jgi:hypothetical protein
MAAVRSFAYYPDVMYTGRLRFSYISAPLLILGVIEDESERIEKLEEGSWGAYIIENKRRIDILSAIALCIFIFIVVEDINEIRIDIIVFMRIYLKSGNE